MEWCVVFFCFMPNKLTWTEAEYPLQRKICPKSDQSGKRRGKSGKRKNREEQAKIFYFAPHRAGYATLRTAQHNLLVWTCKPCIVIWSTINLWEEICCTNREIQTINGLQRFLIWLTNHLTFTLKDREIQNNDQKMYPKSEMIIIWTNPKNRSRPIW